MADLDRIFDLNHALLPSSVRRLSSRDLATLRGIAGGEVSGPSRVRAVEAYTLARGADAVELLSGLLGDPQEDDALRAHAATLLAETPARPAAEQALIAALAAHPEPLVASKIAGSLARVGSRAALEPLGALARGTNFAARRARFAQQVIAHRAGVD